MFIFFPLLQLSRGRRTLAHICAPSKQYFVVYVTPTSNILGTDITSVLAHRINPYVLKEHTQTSTSIDIQALVGLHHWILTPFSAVRRTARLTLLERILLASSTGSFFAAKSVLKCSLELQERITCPMIGGLLLLRLSVTALGSLRRLELVNITHTH